MTYLLSFIIAFIGTIALAPLVIPILRKLKVGQTIRSDGPKRHFGKAGTPTMGGLIFLIPVSFSALLISSPNVSSVLLVLMLLGFGLIGFTDDYIKVVLRRSLGLKARWKLSGQIFLSLVLAFISVVFLDRGTDVWIPFYGDIFLGWLYLPFVIFVVVGATNAVNLTDGLDGLASGTMAIATLGFFYVSLLTNNIEAAIFSSTLIGGCLGFLIFNFNPAKVFMGDTGSLALGAALATLAVLTKTEILLMVIGGIFVIETLSVIIQVIFFRLTGKRVFLMSPLHHHFELKGWGERKIVSFFYLLSFAFVFIGVFLVNFKG
jgi:phospho-N-acetylmuramoyl-pentapeptide-transferase